MIENFSKTTFVNTKIGGAATVDELENVAEVLASKIEELIDDSEAKDKRIEKLEEAVKCISSSLDNPMGMVQAIGLKDMYKIYVDCLNCGQHRLMEIKEGTKISENKCGNCGCETLIKAN